MALRIFIRYMGAKHGIHSNSEPDSLEVEHLLEQTRRFWSILYEQRATFFRTDIMRACVRIAFEDIDGTFADNLTTCLIIIDRLWEDNKR